MSNLSDIKRNTNSIKVPIKNRLGTESTTPNVIGESVRMTSANYSGIAKVAKSLDEWKNSHIGLTKLAQATSSTSSKESSSIVAGTGFGKSKNVQDDSDDILKNLDHSLYNHSIERRERAREGFVTTLNASKRPPLM